MALLASTKQAAASLTTLYLESIHSSAERCALKLVQLSNRWKAPLKSDHLSVLYEFHSESCSK